MATEKLRFEFDGDASKFKQAIQQSNKSVNNFGSNLAKIGGIIAGAFAVDKLLEFGSAIIETTSSFERFEAVLTNTLGSTSEAQKALSDITDFASRTPFSVLELTDSFVRLANQGFKPTREEMRKLGDLASSTGKQFDMLAEAVIDAQVGEFERLKEFGIRAEKQGDKVTFTFKGVKKQVDFTAQSIQDYVLSLGDIEGVSGAMASISETLGGQISNLGDSFDSLQFALGQELKPVLEDVISSMSTLFTKTTEFLQSGGIKTFFGNLLSGINPLAGQLIKTQGQVQKTVNEVKKAVLSSSETIKKSNEKISSSTVEVTDKMREEAFEMFLANDTAKMLQPTMRGVAEGFDIATLKTREYLTSIQESTNAQKQFAMVSNFVTTGLNLVFDALSDPTGFDSFVKSIKKVIVQLLKQLAIMTAISAIFSLVTGGKFVFSDIFKAVTGLGRPTDGFKLFAEGGIVTKPTMGIIGENNQSEAVIPLNRLPQMMGSIGGNQRGEFTLRGQDLILALERAGDFRTRVTG
tara:strand:+ start:1957 stop:3522 length:1566 start_codon:yes stop_codon:yes gene_type:complete